MGLHIDSFLQLPCTDCSSVSPRKSLVMAPFLQMIETTSKPLYSRMLTTSCVSLNSPVQKAMPIFLYPARCMNLMISTSLVSWQ